MPTSVAAHEGGMKISEANRRPRHERRGAGEGEKRTSHIAHRTTPTNAVTGAGPTAQRGRCYYRTPCTVQWRTRRPCRGAVFFDCTASGALDASTASPDRRRPGALEEIPLAKTPSMSPVYWSDSGTFPPPPTSRLIRRLYLRRDCNPAHLSSSPRCPPDLSKNGVYGFASGLCNTPFWERRPVCPFSSVTCTPYRRSGSGSLRHPPPPAGPATPRSHWPEIAGAGLT